MKEEKILNEKFGVKRLAHVSLKKFKVLKPTGIDFGNRFQKPGWSLFCYDANDKQSILSMAVYYSTCMTDEIYDDIPEDEPIAIFNDYERYAVTKEFYNIILKNIDKLPVVYIYEFDCPISKIGLGNTSASKEYTVREDITDFTVKKIKITKELIDKYVTIKSKKAINKAYDDDEYQKIYNARTNKFFADLIWNKEFSINMSQYGELTQAIRKGKLKPGDDIEKYLYNKLGYTLNTRRDHRKLKEQTDQCNIYKIKSTLQRLKVFEAKWI